MLANQASSTPPTTAASSDQRMPDGAGRLWTSLGQRPGLQMAWRRLPVFRSDMERRSAVVSSIVAVPDARSECYNKAVYQQRCDSCGSIKCGRANRTWRLLSGVLGSAPVKTTGEN